MASERWRKIERIYDAALQRAPSERPAFLESVCVDDEALRRDVERLLAANEKAGGFLASPAWEVAPGTLVSQTMTVDRDPSLVGRHVGHYSVLAPLGVGGMGEVYRAHDSRLNRQVALKVLPDLFAINPDRLARFKREAHVLASLNHPNIAAIYGFEDAGDVKALVLELVEGPTLADRIARGPITLEEALPIARQIADALEAAHERGIVHRDLKPANVKVRTDGVVKVLDFGLARALEVESSGDALTESPIVPSPLVTADGIIVGTPAYMAPEQARGKAADKRTDLWAFGCVLYEMLTGRRPFSGRDTSETLAAVVKDEPDWRALPDATPLPIYRLLQRCLVKDPKARAADASIARIEIDDAVASPDHDVPARWRSRRVERVAWAAALASVAAVGIAATMWALRPSPAPSEIRVEISTPPTADPLSLAISPDGQKIVFVNSTEGRSRLELRTLDSGSAFPLAGTEDAGAPFWSPDSQSVAFFNQRDNTLRRANIDGRSLTVVTQVPGLGLGGTWNRDDTILFASNPGLFRVSADGGEPTPVTTGPFHTIPQFLPDGRHFLFFVPNSHPAGVYVGQLDGSVSKRLLDADATPVYVSGHLLFVRQGALFAQAFDPNSLALTGNPFRVAEHVAWLIGFPAAVSASSTGTVIYRSGPAGPLSSPRQLVWFDRAGNKVGEVGDPESRVGGPALSPDGRHVILSRGAPPEIGLLALDRAVWTRLTTEAALVHLEPIWSPDGSRIVFSANPKGPWDLYEKPAYGAGNPQLLLASPADGAGLFASDWSLDGRFVLYGTEADPKTRADIWALPIERKRPESFEGNKPLAIVQTPFDESNGQFAPDGKWIAYQSNETGRFEIYLQQFPSGRKERVSANGGAQVRWRRDGKELFYIAFDDRLMSVPIELSPNGPAVGIGSPVPLFTTRVGGAAPGPNRQQYVVSPDGKRFLMSTLTGDVNTSPITVIFNWRPRPR
jgi:serine/threonine protein kinase